jgi:autotransporter-associated beta strand protein
VTVVKVGSNTQTFSGANTYSGTTTINGGTLRVNGTHAMDQTLLLPVGDYTVNTAGTLGGTGTIGSAADPVDIINNGGKIAPGDGIGTLTVNGNVTFGTNAQFDIDVLGSMADQLAVVGNLNLSALGNVLNVSGSGSGSWVIATYTGSLMGTFETIPSGLSINYGTGSNSQITISGTIAAAGLPGDYNNDGKVDAADYTVWRNHLGEANEANLNNNGDGGNVSGSDYTWWKQHYGTMGPGSGGLSGGVVPEPASAMLVLFALGLVGLYRVRR